MSKKLVCLTPVKNEEWILERFIKSAATWADHIIIADQHSTDRSREIAASFDKVTLVINESTEFDELQRQKLLIDSARKLGSDNILVALDADEFLSGNFPTTTDWQKIQNANPGTTFLMRWANVHPDCKRYWLSFGAVPFWFVDDGSPHKGRKIHSGRVPVSPNREPTELQEIRVLHHQYIDNKRMRSKHRWYMAWEWLNNERNSPLAIYRQYHHMNATKKLAFEPIPDEWISFYADKGIDLMTIDPDQQYWWDQQVLKLFEQHGCDHFSKIALWDANWQQLASHYQMDNITQFGDPRSQLQKRLHQWMDITQPNAHSFIVKAIDKALRGLGL